MKAKIAKKWTGLMLLFSLFLSPSVLWALPIETDTALTLGFESNALRSFMRVRKKTNLLKEGHSVSDPENKKVTIYSTPLIVPIRLKPNIVLTVIAPILRIDSEKTNAGLRKKVSSSGIGDLQLVIKHAFFRKNALKKTSRVAWLAGIKVPTGDETASPALGSGSVDFVVGGVVTHIVNRFAVHADLKFKINTEAKGLRVGNSLKHDIALEYRILPEKFKSISDQTVNLIVELNGLYQEKNKNGGVSLANTGGETLFLSPGIQWIISPRFIIEGLFQHPIIQELNGTQLGIDYTASLGFRYSF